MEGTTTVSGSRSGGSGTCEMMTFSFVSVEFGAGGKVVVIFKTVACFNPFPFWLSS